MAKTLIATIIGARPQFIKTPLVSKAIRKFAREIIIHTGQHYDAKMSDIFFRELKIPKPDYNLGVGSGPQGKQTAKMLEKIEKVLIKEKPNLVIIYGDTNSTIAGALAAAKLHILVAHIEAGMRSYNRQMPEELNRIVSDHLSDLLFCSTKSAVRILKTEGITKGVYFVGDVMCDIQKLYAKRYTLDAVLKTLNLKPKTYLLATIHRQENTDIKENLENILSAFSEIEELIVWPIHPRASKLLKTHRLLEVAKAIPNLKMIEPVGYLEMLSLDANAKMILTDSGGVQKEAYLAKVPCVTLRNETEWTETVASGWNHLTGTDTAKIVRLAKNFPRPKNHPNFLGDGQAHQKIAKIIKKFLISR